MRKGAPAGLSIKEDSNLPTFHSSAPHPYSSPNDYSTPSFITIERFVPQVLIVFQRVLMSRESPKSKKPLMHRGFGSGLRKRTSAATIRNSRLPHCRLQASFP